MDDLNTRCTQLVVELGLGRAEDVTAVEALTGGVASDIARVRVKGTDYCAKFARAKLKVAEDWHAPVHRNAAEYAWLSVASALFPDAALKLYGRSAQQHGFAMEYLSGEDTYLWKTALLSGDDDEGEAQRVGDVLGRIHAASTGAGFDRGPFKNRDDFAALRLEPYLTFTAQRHPNLHALTALADALYASDRVLVHGDVSPKNILFRGGWPILLDAECATMGDASFDPSFCLNHLILKSIHLPSSASARLRNVEDLWSAYARHVTWEDVAALEARVCRLLPALMLARVDGKSPVEYLGETNQDRVREVACALIKEPARQLSAFLHHLQTKLREISA